MKCEKGFVQEMFYFVIIFLAIFMLFIFFTYQRGTRGIEVKKSVWERTFNEEITGFVLALFSNKLPVVEKVYVELAIDAILEGNSTGREMNKTFYGVGIGKVNVSEIIPPLIDYYGKDRLEVKIETPNGTFIYGKVQSGKVIYSYQTLIPIPEERVGIMTIRVGEKTLK